jgi:hypothetical protein
MYVCAVGDIHGNIIQMYDEVRSFEKDLGVYFSYVLQVGDFGVWTKQSKLDRATIKHGDVGDFPELYEKGFVVPNPTIFIKGNHEDFDF